jgi:hypothetical protein
MLNTGKRPKGNGLFSFLYHHYVDAVGVAGYDPIQGALSPPLRLRAHISAMLFLWTILLLGWPLLVVVALVADDTSTSCRYWNLPDAFWYTAAAVVTVYSAHFYVVFNLLSGVSLPSGPRPYKMTRQPAWKNAWVPAPAVADKWRCAYAKDSHQVTMSVFQGTGASLTGEPAGRDIWTGQGTQHSQESQQVSQNKRVDERLVQELASGGREAGFNPAVNPNRYVRYIYISHCIVLSCTE